MANPKLSTLAAGSNPQGTDQIPVNRNGVNVGILFSDLWANATGSINIPSGSVYKINSDTGLSRDSAGVVDIGNGSAADTSGSVKLVTVTHSSTGVEKWSTDTGLSRTAAGVIAVGNGAQGDVTGTLKAAAIGSASLVGASNGNTVVLLNYGPSATAIVGNAAVQNVFSYTLPANTLGINKGVRFTAIWNHSTGTANVVYAWNFGATAPTGFNSTNTGLFRSVLTVFNKAATNVQDVFQDMPVNTSGNINGSMSSPASTVDTTASVTVTFTFNVAATDQVTPKLFYAELLQ